MKKGLIVITGASSGIGKATANIFSKSGYPLLLLARRLDKLNELRLPNTLSEFFLLMSNLNMCV
jgi:NADP-dependent 3-hydroxy acid dehydrogenase YdfG